MADASGFTINEGPPPESDDETIKRLANLTLAEYERFRSAEA